MTILLSSPVTGPTPYLLCLFLLFTSGKYRLVMGCDQNLRETSVKVNLRFTIFGNHEIRECQFSLFFVILSEKFANF